MTRSLSCLALLAWAAMGCNPQDHVGPDGFYAFGVDEDTAPFLMVEDTPFVFVETRVEIPLRAPSEAALETLRAERPAPFPRLPWVALSDLPIEVDFALTNLLDGEVEVTVVVNGFNEFHEYVPTFEVVDDELVAGFSQWERKVRLEPFETLERTIREEEFREVAVDLATVVNGAPNANQIVYFENQSDRDPRAAPYIPEVVPGLVGFRLGLQVVGTAKLVLEATVRVRNPEGRLADPEEDGPEEIWRTPQPMPFSPMVEEP